jgi:hypothetical protein
MSYDLDNQDPDNLPSIKTAFGALGNQSQPSMRELTLAQRTAKLAQSFGLFAYMGIGLQETLNGNLQKAAKIGDLQQLTYWHNAGGDIQGDYNRALKFAIHAGAGSCVEYLINNGANENDQWELDQPCPEQYKTYDSITAVTVADSLLVTSLSNSHDKALQQNRAHVRSLLKTPTDSTASVLHPAVTYVDVVKPV